MNMNKRGEKTKKQLFNIKLQKVIKKYRPKNEQELIEALKKEKVKTYKRGNKLGIFLGKRKMRLDAIHYDYLNYKDEQELYEANKKAKQNPPQKAKQIPYQEKLERLNIINNEHENEQENEQGLDMEQ